MVASQACSTATFAGSLAQRQTAWRCAAVCLPFVCRPMCLCLLAVICNCAGETLLTPLEMHFVLVCAPRGVCGAIAVDGHSSISCSSTTSIQSQCCVSWLPFTSTARALNLSALQRQRCACVCITLSCFTRVYQHTNRVSASAVRACVCACVCACNSGSFCPRCD